MIVYVYMFDLIYAEFLAFDCTLFRITKHNILKFTNDPCFVSYAENSERGRSLN